MLQRTLLTAAILALTVAAGAAAADGIARGYAATVDETGAIRVPALDYRSKWPLLGAWAVAGGDEVDGQTGSSGVHLTYTQPGVIEHYRKTGRFPEGAVLLKELRTARTEAMTTGTVSHAAGVAGWFVMVRDTRGRFAASPLWGDGWGWAYFEAGDPAKTTTSDYKTECLGCHVPARTTDWVYIRGYPALHDAVE